MPSQAPVTREPRFGLTRPVWLLGFVSLFTDMATEMIYPLLPLFLTRVLKAGPMSLGVIEGVAEAANSALKIISGRLADSTGRPKRLVLIGYGISSAIRPFIGVASSWFHVLGIRFADRLGKGIRGAPRDAMLADFAPEGQRGRVFGFHRAMDHAGAVLGPLLAALFLYFYPGEYRTLFALTIIPGIIVIAIILAIPESPRPVPHAAPAHPGTKPPRHPGTSALEHPSTKPPRHPGTSALEHPSTLAPWHLTRALVVIFLFALGNASNAFLLLRLSAVGIADFWIPLLWSALHGVKVVSSLIGGELSDRFGRRTLIGIGWLFYTAVYSAFAVTDTPSVLIAVFLSYGIYFGLTEGVEKAWIADLAPPERRGTAFGYYNATLGVGALLASVLFGLIWTRVSPQAAFYTGAGLAGVATLLLYFLFSHETNPRHE
ncbi:MFS transporter [soil metagenome]